MWTQYLEFTQSHFLENISIDLIHKSHNASVPCPIMHHFVAEMCTHGALWDICEMYCGICEMGLLFESISIEYQN